MSKDLEEALMYAFAKIDALNAALHSALEAIDRGIFDVRQAVIDDLNAEAKAAYETNNALIAADMADWENPPMEDRRAALIELQLQLKERLRKG